MRKIMRFAMVVAGLTAVAGGARLWGAAGAPSAMAEDGVIGLAVADAIPAPADAFVPDPPPASDSGGRPVGGSARDVAGRATAGAGPFALPGFDNPAGDGLLSVTRIESGADTFVSFRNRGSHYGDESRIFVGEHPSYGATRGLIWWDAVGELPKNQAVEDATMELYLREAGPTNDPGRDIVIRRVKLARDKDRQCEDSWDEDDPSWDDFPDFDDHEIDRTKIGTTRDTYDWDVTELVQRWRLAEWWPDHWCNGGVYLQGYETGGSFRGFDSSEGSNEPDLVVEHVTDTKPPVATMSPLPQYINAPDSGNPTRATIRLAWTGDDPEPYTGIDYFQAFARENGGQWQVLGTKLQTFGGSYFGTNGHRYDFNVYPYDQAGNVQPGKAPDATTLVDWSPPVATMYPLPAWVPGPFDLRWTAQDLPNDAGLVNSGLDSYEVQYNIGGTSWGLLGYGIKETGVRFNQAAQCSQYQFRVAGKDKAGNAELMGAVEAQTTVDGVAPVVTMRSTLPIGKRDFTVSWQAEDNCAFGIAGYDVQYRRGVGGAWTDWVTNGQETSRVFTGEWGESYRFRARARDAAGNVSAYPDSPPIAVVVVDPATLTFKIQLPIVGQNRR